jgi:hypothetical protein
VKIDNILLEKFAKISILYLSQNGRKMMMNWLRFLLMGMVAYAAFSIATTARSEEVGVNEPFLEPLNGVIFEGRNVAECDEGEKIISFLDNAECVSGGTGLSTCRYKGTTYSIRWQPGGSDGGYCGVEIIETPAWFAKRLKQQRK